jgi:hypothetical protein
MESTAIIRLKQGVDSIIRTIGYGRSYFARRQLSQMLV